MEKIKLESSDKKNTPIIVLKPSTNESVNGNIYLVERDLFFPTPESISLLIDFLNSFKIEDIRHVKSISDKLIGVDLARIENIILADCEKKATDNECNILGGIFIVLLKQFGVSTGKIIGILSSSSIDDNFIRILYPDIEQYFTDPSKLSEEMINHAEGVIYNNTGSFKVVEVNNELRLYTADLLKKMTALKRIFRYAVKNNIPYKKTSVRCNLVHTPETENELEIQSKLFVKPNL